MRMTVNRIYATHIILYTLPIYIISLSMSRGFYSLPAFLLLSFFLLLTYFAFLKDKFKPSFLSETGTAEHISSICVFSIALSFFFLKGIYQNADLYLYSNYASLSLVLILVLSYKANVNDFLIRNRFLIIIFLSILIRLFIIQGSPSPKIDVYEVLKNGPLALLNGHNPYSHTYSKIYTEQEAFNYFPYPPFSLLILLPFVGILHDPRYLYILTETLTALILYSLSKKRVTNRSIYELIPVLYLFFPQSFFIFEQSWLDPLIVFFLTTYAYAVSNGRLSSRFYGILLGMASSIKAYTIIIPIFFLRSAKNKTVIIIALLFLASTLAPFFLIDPQSFNPYRTGYEYRFDSLTINSFLNHNLNYFIPKTGIYIIWFMIFVIFFWKKTNDLSQAYISMALWFTGLFFFSFIGFINEYHLPFGLLLIAYTLSLKEKSTLYQTLAVPQKRAQ